MADWQIPGKLAFLFKPRRYKVARGGRGSAKSWSFARALLILAYQRPLRILCTREVQHTVKQSVYQLLVDQIERLGLQGFFHPLASEIRGTNGSLFMFAGLSDLTADNIKSYEGVDIVWVEEAHMMTGRSWKILIPTIRKDGSEIWVSYNPELETDETHQRFVINPPPDCISVEVNWSDNPWFPAVLNQERLHAKATMSEAEYNHIWEGKCKPAVEGAIYFAEMSKAASRISAIPHDPLLKTQTIWDLGFNDSMAIILAQKLASEIRIVHYIEDEQRTLADYSRELKALQLDGQAINWGSSYLPHDGYAKRHQTGKTDEQVLISLGWQVSRVPNMDIETGIKRAREVFPRIYFNAERTARLVECLKRYRRHVNKQTGEPGQPLHDEFSHGADVFRYLAVSSDQFSNDTWGGKIKYPSLGVV
jgi:phage terminase large subunit